MYLVCIGLFYYFCTQKRVTWKQFKAERSIRHSCQVITSKSGNSSKVLCIRHKRKFSRITQIVCKCVVSAGEFEIVGAGNDPVDRFPMPEFVLLLRAGAMFSVEHSGLSVYSVFVRGRLRRPVVSLRNPGRILSDTALRGPGFAGVAVGEGPGSGGDRIKNSTTGIIFIKNNYLCW